MTMACMNGFRTPHLGSKIARLGGLALLGVGLLVGGCNKGVKAERDQLVQENTTLRDQLAAQQAANAEMQRQMTAQPAVTGGADFYGEDTGGGNGYGRSSRAPREQVIEIAGDVLFDSGQTSIKPSARASLDRVANQIQSRHSGRTVRVVGHTDSDPIRKSKWGSNEALSRARADAVADYLASKGISRSSITTVGKGSSEPKGSKAASRRVEIVIVDMQ